MLRSLELDIKQYQDNIKKYSQQLADIKTNKEYKALNSEIAYLKEKISELESQELELMEEESECKKNMDKAENILEEAKKIQQEREDELRKKIASLDSEIENLRVERIKLAQTLPQAVVKQYAKLLKHKNNCAVTYARNGACGACGFVIRPQVRIEIQQRNKINYCENCGRILMEKFKDI
jgi:predicted  nucleic acid-binding Zn-ribbon protein